MMPMLRSAASQWTTDRLRHLHYSLVVVVSLIIRLEILAIPCVLDQQGNRAYTRIRCILYA